MTKGQIVCGSRTFWKFSNSCIYSSWLENSSILWNSHDNSLTFSNITILWCCTPKGGTLRIMAILSVIFMLLEHFLNFKIVLYSLKLTNAIRCYKWNTFGNFFPLSVFTYFLKDTSAVKSLLSMCSITFSCMVGPMSWNRTCFEYPFQILWY